LMDIQDPEVQAFALYLHLNKLEWTSIAYLLQTPETKAQHIQEYSAEEMVITTWYHFFFFLVTRGVRVSLRAPQLIPGPTEHPASPVGR
jgi:hypothetical protein